MSFLKFYPAEGRFIGIDKAAAGQPTIFDTNDGSLFTPAPNVFSGSISVPARGASSSGVDGSQNVLDISAEYYIGTPNVASANIVRGHISYDGSLWKKADGTHVKEWDAIGQSLKPQTDSVTKLFVGTMQSFTPYVNTLGHLAILERTVIRARDPGSPPSITKSLPAFTLQYRLHADFWWGNPEIVQKPDAAYRSHYAIIGQTSFTSNMPAGYEYPGRRLVAVIHTRSAGAAPTSVVIGGVAAIIHDSVFSANTGVTIASAVVPTGETVPVVVTYAAAPNRQTLCLYAVRNVAGGAPSITKTTIASGVSASLTIDIGVDKCAIIASSKLGGSGPPTCTWTNANEVMETALSVDSGASAAIIGDGASGSLTVTASWTSSAGDISMIAAVFS